MEESDSDTQGKRDVNIHSLNPDAQAEEDDRRDDAVDDARGAGNRRHRRPRRGIFLIPNLITTGALFAGFYAIVAAMNGKFEPAALAIFAAILLDTADGRVARITHTESAFGAEYDSLSDMVAFGVAPALIAFTWTLSSLGKIGWVVTFIYMACAALRLARYNTQGDNDSFTGLPSPSAAALVVCAVWSMDDMLVDGELVVTWMSWLTAVLIATAGILMVANVTYMSPKRYNFQGRVPFISLVVAVIVFAIVLAKPPEVLLTLALLYALSGPAQLLWEQYIKRKV
ncbi:MAG: CDP-diacylglycerol--serine O-phosphatidyltransferase [Pseudomonadales bacterium]|nr:CDP-diacylglycerol--serine O-phosphatidyltransferase [Pseudomonadales bacterium]